jgi:site-specific DNA recombinase
MTATVGAPGATPRAVLYDRVSTLSQARSGYSGGADGFQLDRCRAHADGRGYAVVGQLTDTDSGAEWNTAGIMQALDLAKQGAYDVLVVSDTSRFARNLAKKCVYEGELRRGGVRVEYLNLPADDGPEGRFMSNIWGSLDEYERERIAWRTEQGRLAKARLGRVVGSGPAPYGYRYVTRWDETKRKAIPLGLEPDPDTAQLVQRMYREIREHSAVAIARRLTAEGIPTPRTTQTKRAHWGNSTVRAILKHTVHKGAWSYNGITVEVPALVDPRTWDDAQGFLTERLRMRRGRRPESDAYELRGLMTCGHCGGTLSTCSNRVAAGRARQRTYVCLRSHPRLARTAGWAPCTLGMFDAAAMEREAWRVVSDVLLKREALAVYLQHQRATHADARATHAQRLAILDEEIGRHERVLRRAVAEKLGVEPDDERYAIYEQTEAHAALTVKRLRQEREHIAGLPMPGLSDDDAAALERFAERMTKATGDATQADRVRVYRAIRLRPRVERDAEHGVRIGRSRYLRIAWDADIPLDSEHDVLTSSM